MKRSLGLLAVALAAAACDEWLEDPADPDAYLRFGWPPPEVSVPQGAERQLTVTISRTPDYHRDVSVSVEGVPNGVTASVSASRANEVTTAIVTLRVAETMALGRYTFRLRVRAERLRDSDRLVVLHISEPPRYAMTTSASEVRIVKGGIAPLAVHFDRTNFPEPITLSLTAPPGITAAFVNNPVTSNRADMLLSVAPDVASGTHPITIRATAPPLAERTVTASVIVTSDHLQVIVDTAVSARQGATTRKSFIVNWSTVVDGVGLAAEGLPAGVTAAFDGSGSREPVMSVSVHPAVPAGRYPVTIRATANGVPDATSEFGLTITTSRIALALAADSVSVYQGATASTTLTIQRTSLDTTVALGVEAVPSGVTVTTTPASVSGTSASVSVSAASSRAPGEFDVTIVATPTGWPADAATRTTLHVSVREVVAGEGNVLLDWSRCSVPVWVAAQDGSQAWQQVVPAAGLVRFGVNSGRGGFAFVAGDSLTVRYMLQADLTARPFDMCPPEQPTKTVSGAGVHGAADQTTYGFGGASASSSGANPDFSLLGVRPGIHDLVAWTMQSGVRGLIRRDLDLGDGESIGSVEMASAEAFVALRPTLTHAGTLFTNETVSHSMSYLTTKACTVNPLYVSGNTSRSTFMFGVPTAFQRPTDFHLLTAEAVGPGRTRRMTFAFNRIDTRTVNFEQLVNVSVVTLSGAYKRLQASNSNVVPPSYNTSVILRYGGGGRVVTVHATRGWTGSAVQLAAPDFSSAGGWQNAFGPATDVTGSWTVTFEGQSGDGLCSENHRGIMQRLTGTF